MRLPWTRVPAGRREGNHAQLPDGDTVVPDGRRRTADMLAEQQKHRARWADLIRPVDLRDVQAAAQAARNALCGPTVPLPINRPPLTPAQRGQGGRR